MRQAPITTGVLLMSAFVLIPYGVHAQVVISEIMYDLDGADSGHEWVEVFNAGDASIQLTEWRLFEAGINHKITAVSGGEILASGAYAVIADNAATFLSDHGGYSGTLFDSAFSLSNSGESIGLRDADLADKDSVAYNPDMGASGDGNSLQRTSVSGTSFTAGAPTPGSGSLAVSDTPATGTNTAQDTMSTADTDTKTTSSPPSFSVEPQIYAYAGKDRTVIVGADVALDGQAFSKSGELLENVRFLWNFGDGAVKEGESVLHHWNHPGRYVLVLDIAQQKNAASDSVIITAEPAKIALGTLADGSVVITNNAGRTLDLSGWHLRMAGRIFTIPQHSRFLAGEEVAFSPEVTGLSIINHPAEMLYPNGVVAVSESTMLVEAPPAVATAQPPVRAAADTQSAGAPSGIIGRTLGVRNSVPEQTEDLILESEVASEARAAPIMNQAAAASAAGPSAMPWVIGLFGFTGLAGFAAVGLRRYARRTWQIVEEVDEEV